MMPSTQQVNPNPAFMLPAQRQAAAFTQGLLADPFGRFQQGVAPPGGSPQGSEFQQILMRLTGQQPAMASTGNPFAVFLNQPSPEERTLEQTRGDLLAMLSGGGMGAGRQVIAAAQPIFQENLQTGLTTAAAAAPSVFGSGFAGQTGDITRGALRDFNLFQGQALQQGQQTALQAAQQLGMLSSQAGQALVNRFINPTLQLLLGTLQFAHPAALNTVTGPSGLQMLIDAAQAAGTIGLAAKSSQAFKTDIQRLSDNDHKTNADRIRKLNLFRYRYRPDADGFLERGKEHVGVIVEDTTTPDEARDADHISLYDLLSVTMSALKNAFDRIDDLESQLKGA